MYWCPHFQASGWPDIEICESLGLPFEPGLLGNVSKHRNCYRKLFVFQVALRLFCLGFFLVIVAVVVAAIMIIVVVVSIKNILFFFTSVITTTTLTTVYVYTPSRCGRMPI